MIIDSKTEPTMGILISRDYCSCKKDNSEIVLTFWKNDQNNEKQVIKQVINLSQASCLGGIIGTIIDDRRREFGGNGFESYHDIEERKIHIQNSKTDECNLFIGTTNTDYGKRVVLTIHKDDKTLSIILCGKAMGYAVSHNKEKIIMSYDILDIPLMSFFTGLYSYLDLDLFSTPYNNAMSHLNSSIQHIETSVLSFIDTKEQRVKNEEKISRIIASKRNIDFENLHMELKLVEDLKCDWLDYLDLAFTLEHAMNTRVDETAVSACKTVGDIVKYISDCAEKIFVKRR